MTAAFLSPLRRATTAISSLALASLLIFGSPTLLLWLAGSPLPEHVPSLDQITRAFSQNAVSDAAMIKALAIVGWVAWLMLCWSLLVETWAWIRGRPAPDLRLAGPFQTLARRIVAATSLLVATGMTSSQAPPALATADSSALVVQTISRQIDSPASTAATRLTTAPATSVASVTSLTMAVPAAPRSVAYTVQRRDSLWRIAECRLGNPMRWREIWELNRGRDFDGVRFTNANLIYPGWVLDLPVDALGDPPVPSPEAAASAVEAPPLEVPAPEASPLETPPENELVPSLGERSTTAAPLSTPTVTPSPTARPAPTTSIASPSRDAPTNSPSVSGNTQRTGGGDRATVRRASVGNEQRAPLFIGGITLATALLAILTRARRSQFRRRQPGHSPYVPPPELADTEASIRQSADPDRIDRLTTALRAFAAGVGGQELPELEAVRLARGEVEILLATPLPQTPAGFQDCGEHRVFATETGISVTTLQGLASDATSLWPSLVTVGCIGEDLVYIDLETAGILAVSGKDDADTVRRIAAELATTPISDLIELICIGDQFDLATSDRIRSAPTMNGALEMLANSKRGTRSALDQFGDADTSIARHCHSSEQGWGVTVLLSLDPLTETERDQLADITVPKSGIAAVVVGDSLDVGWSLTSGDTAHLEPHGFDLDPLILREPDLAAVDDLLSDAVIGDTECGLLVEITDSEPDLAPEIYIPPAIEPASHSAEADVEIRVLGQVEVHGVPPINRRRTVEVITYLALHPHGVTAGHLKTAIWPDAAPSQDTFNVTVYRARSALGTDRNGDQHLPHAVASAGDYMVGPFVTTDLARFTDLVNQSASATDDADELTLLHQALELLRGQPFEGVGGYNWAFTEGIVVEAEAMIADAAHKLAQLALAAEDAELATWAAMTGLKSVPGSEPLYRDRMEAAHLNGDPAAVERIVEELCRYIETLDPLDDLHPETIELWHRIGRPSSRR